MERNNIATEQRFRYAVYWNNNNLKFKNRETFPVMDLNHKFTLKYFHSLSSFAPSFS